MPARDLPFNDQIMIDCFYIKHVKRRGHWFMSMLDKCTMYHLATRLPSFLIIHPGRFAEFSFKTGSSGLEDQSKYQLISKRVLVINCFLKRLVKQEYRYSPKRGKRIGNMVKSRDMGLSIKDMLGKVITEQNTKTPGELSWAATEMSMAKNILIREHGFSPAQLLLGKESKLFGKIEEKGETCTLFFCWRKRAGFFNSTLFDPKRKQVNNLEKKMVKKETIRM